MSAGRLRVDGPDDADSTAIPSVPAPIQGLGRAQSLAQVLEIVLPSAGLQLGYDDLMGLSGLAFRTPPWPDLPGVSRDEALAVVDAMNEALEPPLSVHGAEEPRSPDEALALVAACVDEGRPCVALGWGSVKERWSVIAGYDRTGERLLGHCVLAEARDAYESWPPDLSLLLTVPAEVKLRGGTVLLDAVERAHRRWVSEGRARYARWIATLDEREDEAGNSRQAAGLREADTLQEAAVELLADARGAATEFLSGLAESVEGNRAAWLAHAAESYARLVEMLEGRGAAPLSEAALAGLQDARWRDAWARRLEQMAELEEAAATALRRSASAEFPPEQVLEP